MLKLSLVAGEYLVINSNIIIQVYRTAGERSYLAVNAPREVPVVRGEVLERQGGKRPACLLPVAYKSRKYPSDALFKWNSGRDDAVRVMREVFDRLDQKGVGEEAEILRTQLDRIIPGVFEEKAAVTTF